jgi:hypothetical protein
MCNYNKARTHGSFNKNRERKHLTFRQRSASASTLGAVLPTKFYRQENPKIRPLTKNFGHSHYFPIEAGFITVYKDS